MELGNSLTMDLSQKLVLTQRMKLSIEILQMNSEELDEFIKKEQESNILIRVEKSSTSVGSYRDDEYDPYSTIGSEDPSFYDLLYEQIGEQKLGRVMKEICEYIVDNIDSRGYLSHWIRHPYNQFDFDRGLEIVRGFEPRGVGADDLRGCLLLQLCEDEVYERILVEDYLEELAYGDKRGIAKGIGITIDTLDRVIERVKNLNPIPSKGYYVEGKKEKLLPDAYVKIVDGRLEVEMNEEVVPKILIEQSEISIYEAKYEKYIKRCRERAQFIINCINQRQQTLKKVIMKTSEKQKTYLLGGKLKPLTLVEVADNLEVHQSTVSRAVKNRYIDIEGSVISLKTFFAKQYRPKHSSGMCEEVTRENIKEKIYEIILLEDRKKPYSDDKIVKILAQKKIEISRRAVAKYREEMKVPASSKRKRR